MTDKQVDQFRSLVAQCTVLLAIHIRAIYTEEIRYGLCKPRIT